MDLDFRTDAWWGTGHYIVHNHGRCVGRVSRDPDNGLWYAYPAPTHPAPDRPLPAALAGELPSRKIAGAVLADAESA